MASVLSCWSTLADEVGLPVVQWMGRDDTPRFHDIQLDFYEPVVFSYYYRRFFSTWVRTARWLFSWDEMTAQDVVQDCCMEYLQRGARSLYPRQFRRYIRRMLVSRGMAQLQREGRYPVLRPLSLEAMGERHTEHSYTWLDRHISALPVPIAASPATVALARQCALLLRTQPERYRRALVLAAQGYSSAQVAAAMGIEGTAVFKVLRRAQQRMTKTMYHQGQRHAAVMASLQDHFQMAACCQCGEIAALATNGRCQACLAQSNQVGQQGCRECGALGRLHAQGVCKRCYYRLWDHRGGQVTCQQCGQVGKVNTHGVCRTCVEQNQQQPCRDCQRVGVSRLVKGRCRACDARMRKRLRVQQAMTVQAIS